MRLLLVVPILLLAAACGPSPGSDTARTPASAGSTDGVDGAGFGDDELVVEVDTGDGTPAERYSLVCRPSVGGDHPAAQEACDHLDRLDDPFQPVPDDAVCTQQYGGPQTAHVTGRWRGEPVDLQLSRTDGCRIAQWDRLGPLLPVSVGPETIGEQPQ